MNVLRMPCLASCVVSVAVETFRRAAFAVSERTIVRGAVVPCAAADAVGETLGCAPKAGSSRSASTIVLVTVPTPASSTSTTSPGSTGREPAGVPVRIRSPGSRVMKRERSATRKPIAKIRLALVSSCMTSPLTRVRSTSASRSSWSAGTYAPSGVNPSCPLANTFEPRSTQRKS